MVLRQTTISTFGNETHFPRGPLVRRLFLQAQVASCAVQYSTVETGADDFEDPVQHVLDPAAFCDGNKAELRQGKTNVGRKFGTHRPCKKNTDCMPALPGGYEYSSVDEGTPIGAGRCTGYLGSSWRR